jgi:uncharacterized protein (DUF2236 family)
MRLPVPDLRATIRSQLDAAVGTHDDPAVYATPPGDPGLCGPGSMSWELNANMGAVAAAGAGAIVLELLHPAVMAGVSDQSNYQTQTERRMRNTFGYVQVTTFGSTDAATALIGRVRRMHERVNGTMPDGRPYRAMDPELIGWVHNAIPWAIMLAFEAYVRPLSDHEKGRYLSEQAVIGRMGGAGDIPTSAAELDEYLDAMRPKLALTEQTLDFLAFVLGRPGGPQPVGAIEQRNRMLTMKASMLTTPPWARQLAGFDHTELGRRLWFDPTMRVQVKLLNWAFGTPPNRRLAEARVAGNRTAATAAA